jgi:hypothetical protein
MYSGRPALRSACESRGGANRGQKKNRVSKVHAAVGLLRDLSALFAAANDRASQCRGVDSRGPTSLPAEPVASRTLALFLRCTADSNNFSYERT